MKTVAAIFMTLVVFVVFGSAKKESSSPEQGNHAWANERNNNIAKRIASGYFSLATQVPWQALILRHGNAYCGGSLIYDKWVITAAHCLQESQNIYSVRLGELVLSDHDGREVDVAITNIYNHPQYVPWPRGEYNDIALIELSRRVSITGANVRTINLPRAGSDPPAGTNCYIAGWGYTAPGDTAHSDRLKYAVMPIVSNSVCGAAVTYITPSKICCSSTPNSSACPGDSGGPLFCWDGQSWYTLQGVISQGNCGQGNSYTIATRVSNYLDWIHQTTGI